MPTDKPGKYGPQSRGRGSRRTTIADEGLGAGFGESTLDNISDSEFSTEPFSDDEQASSGGSNGSSRLAEDAETLKDTARQATSGFVHQARQQAVSQINAQKDRAAEGLSSVAGAIRQTGDRLREENAFVASYIDTAVNQLQQLSDRLRDKQPDEFVRDLEEFARRNPGAFLGGAFILGVGLARFLRSSSEQRREDFSPNTALQARPQELSSGRTGG